MWKAFRSLFAKAAESPNAKGVAIVALVAGQRDRELLERLAGEQHWAIHFRDNCGEAWDLLRERGIPIAICDRDLPGTEWRDVLHLLGSSPGHFVYTILMSQVADDYLWNEVIRRGGYDLLAKPLREQAVLRAVRLGWSYCNSSSVNK
jgi:DNA-binding NtrC family response regulator